MICPLTTMRRWSKVGQQQWVLPANCGLFKKEIPQINALKKKIIEKDDIHQKVKNAEITSRSSCEPNWDGGKNYNI